MAILEEITNPFLRMGYGVIDALPGIIAAILILVLGYIVAWVLGKIVHNVLYKIKFDRWILKKTTLSSVIGDFRLSDFLALITKWYVFILFIPAAANLINLGAVQNFLVAVALWIPQAILAIIIGLIGIAAAEYVGLKIVETKARAAATMATIARVVIWVFTAIIALDQVGVRIDFATNTLLIILAGVMFGLALAFGIGYGLAMKDEAKKSIAKMKRKL